MQYVFTMTSRMVAIAGACAVLLCILLFLLGVEIGKTVAAPSSPLPAGLSVPSVPSIPSLPGAAAPAAAPAGSVSPAAAPATAPAPSTARP